MGKITSQMIARAARAAGFAQLVTDTGGVVTVPFGNKAPLYRPLIGPYNTSTGVSIMSPGLQSVANTTAGAGCTINSAGYTDVNGERWYTVSATGISASNNYFEINISPFEGLSASCGVVEFSTDPSQGTPMYLYLGTTGYAKSASWAWNFTAAGQTEPFHHLGLMAMHCNPSAATKGGGFTEDVSAVPWTVAKLRVPVTNGQTRVFSLRSINLQSTQTKGRLCIVADDGFASWLRCGVPIMEEFGLVTTSALIATAIGQAQYASVADWQRYMSNGHEIVTHGPTGGLGNLIDNFATNSLGVADAVKHRDMLRSFGLMRPEAESCYILPQGKYGRTAGDVSLLDDLRVAGFTKGRSAVIKAPTVYMRGMSSLCHGRVIPPVLGHNYAGAANTPDDAAETANINALITAIQGIAANRSDAHIMFHKVAARGAASELIAIEADRLRTLAAAIRVEVDAGRLDCVRMSEFG